MAEYAKTNKRFCEVCKVYCSSALQLCEHVMGNKHRNIAQRVAPDSLSQLSRLQYFFDNYMKLEPLVGLEYVEETQKMSEYQYKCLLCSFLGNRKHIFQHVIGPDHTKEYLDKHYPMLSVTAARFTEIDERTQALKHAAAKVCKTYGRSAIKEINSDCKEINSDGESPTLKVTAKGSSKRKIATCSSPNRDFCKRTPPDLERADNGCRGQTPEFKDNGDFLDYLQKFEIRNDEDARILKQVAQNCTRALVRFREEQSEPCGEAGPQTSAIKTEKEVNVDGCAEKVAPAASEPQTDATQQFFSSIKNMEESEVVSMLHKIAATNPAFRGFDVSSAIKYLQATGRLKTS